MTRMKELPESGGQSEWNRQLLRDLSFIRKNKRYPFRRMTLMPLLASTVLLGFLFRLILAGSLGFRTGNLNFGLFIILGLFVVPTVIAIKRFSDLIRFFEVRTGYTQAMNMKLLERFLEEQRLVTFRHPEATEIYQIISRNISAGGDEREVLIFIADDSRILINSHFTSSRKWFKLISAPTHHGEMMKAFRKWLAEQEQSGSELKLSKQH